MSFGDLAKAAMDFAVSGPASESIEYQSVGAMGESQATWRTVNALVDRNADELGIAADRGPRPVVIHVSETDIASVNEQRDRVKLAEGRILRVAEMVERDGGGWSLFCI